MKSLLTDTYLIKKIEEMFDLNSDRVRPYRYAWIELKHRFVRDAETIARLQKIVNTGYKARIS